MDWGQIDGALAVVVVGVALLSNHAATIKFAALMFAVWLTNSWAVELLNYARAPLVLPEINAALGLVLGLVALMAKNRVGAVIFGLFLVSAFIWAVAILTHTQDTRLCYALANATFLAREVLIGAVGVKEGLDRWADRRDVGFGHLAPGRTSYVARVERWK